MAKAQVQQIFKRQNLIRNSCGFWLVLSKEIMLQEISMKYSKVWEKETQFLNVISEYNLNGSKCIFPFRY